MNSSSRLLLVLLCSLFVSPLFSQIDFYLQLMPDGTKWGVYAAPRPNTNISNNTITGSGQITIVAPLNFAFIDFTPVNGNWSNNATVHGPSENPTKSYLSVGFVQGSTEIDYSASSSTLLFTFNRTTTGCPNELYLMDNENDPFNQLPNSLSSNPGNELTIFDVSNFSIHEYSENIKPFAWDCHDCDNDGIANALEDTNGDGQWTPGVDVSDLCNGSGNSCIEITGVQLRCEGGGTACGNQPTGPISLAIDIAGGLAPFKITYSTGTTLVTLDNYQSGAVFQVPATNGANYKLVEVKGADGCVAPLEGLSGEIPVTVAGSLQFTIQPANLSLCSSVEAMLTVCATASNSTFKFNWQYSSDNGVTWEAVPMGLIFNQTNTGTLTSGCDTLMIGATVGLNGYQFRVVASGNNLTNAYSNVATLSLGAAPQFTQQPQSLSVCEGQSVSFGAILQNSASLSYQWQVSTNGGVTWANLSQSGNIAGTQTPTLTIQTTSAAMNNQAFRLRAQAGSCPPVFSQAAYLVITQGTVTSELVYAPTVCRGTETCLQVNVAASQTNGLSYQWQERTSGSNNWVNIAGATADILCLTGSSVVNGSCFRVVFNLAGCQPSISEEGCISVEGEPAFVQQPQTQTKCYGEPALLTASANIADGLNGNLTYRWQTSADAGQTWEDLNEDNNFSGTSSSALSIENPAAVQGHLLRLATATANCGAAYSEAAQVYVEGPIVITQQPVSLNICYGNTAKLVSDFYAANTGNPDSEIAIRWQESSNGTDWAFVPDDGSYLDIYTLQLTIPNATVDKYYRLFFQYPTCDPIYTDVVFVDVTGAVAITAQPAHVGTCGGEKIVFQAAATSTDALVYQWEASDDLGATWSAIAEGTEYTGTTTNALTVVSANSSSQFRLSVAVAGCTAAYTNAAQLTVEAPIVFNQQPASQAACPGNEVIFTSLMVAPQSTTMQWQVSTDGTTWTDIAEGNGFFGTETSALHVVAAEGMDGLRFRLLAASQYCGSMSSEVILNILDEATCNPIIPEDDCVKLAVKLLPNQQGWGVWAKADADFTESFYQLPTGGKVTLVAPSNFTFTNFTSIAGGKWKFGKAMYNPSGDPGKIYMEFYLIPNQNFLNLEPGGEIMLFRFDHVGPCPSSLKMMENIIPTGFFPNEFTGVGALDGNAEAPFHVCGNYAQGQWNCPGGWSIVAPENDFDQVMDMNVELETSQFHLSENEVEAVTTADFIGVAPNPTRGELVVSLDATIAEQPATLRLWNMQGQLMLTQRTEGNTVQQLDLSEFAPGSYLLSLEVDGKVLQREKVIVQ